MSKHPWEVKHEYYCNDAEYWRKYESFEDFQEEEGDSDMDYNLLVRWDWEEEDGETGEPNYNGDDYHRNGKLKLYFVSQRKGLLRSVDVEVCRADEKEVIEYLTPRLQHLHKLWEPLSLLPEQRQSDSGSESSFSEFSDGGMPLG